MVPRPVGHRLKVFVRVGGGSAYAHTNKHKQTNSNNNNDDDGEEGDDNNMVVEK